MLAILTMETIVTMALKATKVFVMGSCQRLVRSTNEEGWRMTLHNYLNYQLLTLKEAADLLGKSSSNIAYLITYKRIKKYDSNGRVANNTGNGSAYVLKSELLDYWAQWNERLKKRRESLNVSDDRLAFYHVSEKERTKHVHRLHPYLGKFIPQLVEYFVKKEFTSKDILLDPFMGSATTLVVASEMGIGSVGIDVSEFNCMIAKAKLCDYDLDKVGQEIKKIYQETQSVLRRAN